MNLARLPLERRRNPFVPLSYRDERDDVACTPTNTVSSHHSPVRGPAPNSTKRASLRTRRVPCTMQVTTKPGAAAGDGAESTRLENVVPVLRLMPHIV